MLNAAYSRKTITSIQDNTAYEEVEETIIMAKCKTHLQAIRKLSILSVLLF